MRRLSFLLLFFFFWLLEQLSCIRSMGVIQINLALSINYDKGNDNIEKGQYSGKTESGSQ